MDSSKHNWGLHCRFLTKVKYGSMVAVGTINLSPLHKNSIRLYRTTVETNAVGTAKLRAAYYFTCIGQIGEGAAHNTIMINIHLQTMHTFERQMIKESIVRAKEMVCELQQSGRISLAVALTSRGISSANAESR